MWQFNWGTFWAVLAAVGIVGLFVGGGIMVDLDVIRQYLSDIEWKIDDIRKRNRP